MVKTWLNVRSDQSWVFTMQKEKRSALVNSSFDHRRVAQKEILSTEMKTDRSCHFTT